MKTSAMKCFALIGVVLFLGIAAAPSITANQIEEIGDEKPDLRVNHIEVITKFQLNMQYFNIQVENIGNVDITNEVVCYVQMYYCFLGVIPTPINVANCYTGVTGLRANGFQDLEGFWAYELPKFGRYIVRAEANIIGWVEEEDYSNNKATEVFRARFGRWSETIL